MRSVKHAQAVQGKGYYHLGRLAPCIVRFLRRPASADYLLLAD